VWEKLFALTMGWPPRDRDVIGTNLVSLLPLSGAGVAGEATGCAHQVKRLGFAGLSRVLAEADLDPVAVLRGGIEQQSFDITRVDPPAHHIQQPKTAVLVAAELDADRPIGVVELGLFGGGEIPAADHVEVGRSLVDDGTPATAYACSVEPFTLRRA
jgi:hypothetical protein